MKIVSIDHGPNQQSAVPVMKGLAAVSRLPRPLPMMKMHAQNPPKLLALMAGMQRSAPMA